MSRFHLKVETFTRSKGHIIAAKLAYRAGWLVIDERTGVAYDYRRRKGVIRVVAFAPKELGKPGIRQLDDAETRAMWATAERAETRKNSQIAREVVLALPIEIEPAEREKLAIRFGMRLSSQHMVGCSVKVHEPSRGGDQRNVHAHVMWTTRMMAYPEGAAPISGAKTRQFDEKDRSSVIISQMRADWEKEVNALLSERGAPLIDCRSLKARGIERPPRLHLGPAATAMERRGIRTRAGDYNRAIDAAEQDRLNAEQAAAEEVRRQAALSTKTAESQKVVEVDPQSQDPEATRPDAQNSSAPLFKFGQSDPHVAVSGIPAERAESSPRAPSSMHSIERNAAEASDARERAERERIARLEELDRLAKEAGRRKAAETAASLKRLHDRFNTGSASIKPEPVLASKAPSMSTPAGAKVTSVRISDPPAPNAAVARDEQSSRVFSAPQQAIVSEQAISPPSSRGDRMPAASVRESGPQTNQLSVPTGSKPTVDVRNSANASIGGPQAPAPSGGANDKEPAEDKAPNADIGHALEHINFLFKGAKPVGRVIVRFFLDFAKANPRGSLVADIRAAIAIADLASDSCAKQLIIFLGGLAKAGRLKDVPRLRWVDDAMRRVPLGAVCDQLIKAGGLRLAAFIKDETTGGGAHRAAPAAERGRGRD